MPFCVDIYTAAVLHIFKNNLSFGPLSIYVLIGEMHNLYLRC